MNPRHARGLVLPLLLAGTAGTACLADAPPVVPVNASWHALRFHGTGTDQQDRVRIQIDDDAPGPDASAPCDVGAGSFTIEFWVRGTMDENPAAGFGGGVEVRGSSWKHGHALVDRGISGNSKAEWGVSIAGGRVRFGTGRGPTQIGDDPTSTIEGVTDVLDGKWHHVACVRDAYSGRKRIFVDGALDFETISLPSFDDISYPNAGVPNSLSVWNPYLVIGAGKFDAGVRYPSFSGWFDELRVWNVARTASEIGSTFDIIVDADAPGLVGMWRFEEGFGTMVFDSSAAGSPAGELIAGVEGNGEWVSAWSDPIVTAPIRLRPEDLNSDLFVDGADVGLMLTAWGLCPEDAPCTADLNGDGEVNGADLGLLLSNWG